MADDRRKPGTTHEKSVNTKRLGTPFVDPLADPRGRGTTTNYPSTKSANRQAIKGHEIDGQNLRGFAVTRSTVGDDTVTNVSANKLRKLDVGEFPGGPEVKIDIP